MEMAKFHNYSFNNTLLIAMQRPDATIVTGYKNWQSMGRQVKKGEECTEGFTQEVKEKIYSFLQSHEKKRYPNKEQKQRLEFWQKFFENGHFERSWESGMEVNYDAIDGCVNHQKDHPGKALPDPEKKPKKRMSVITRLREKQIAIAKRSGKPLPKYLEQQMVREKI